MFKNSIVSLLRRETSSGEYLAAIDGLRFLAIISVIFFHIHHYLLEKATLSGYNGDFGIFGEDSILSFGRQGVQLFFVISGFILAYPFARYYLGQTDKKSTLKSYFMRRLTRLEPPYILSMLLLFPVAAFVIKAYSVPQLVSSLGASLLYMHNIIFPGDLPYINGVAWSLEIEIQFYILAPLLMWFFYRFKNQWVRIGLLVGIMVVFPEFSQSLRIRTNTILYHFQYFLAGILLCELYLDKTKHHWFKNHLSTFIGFILLAMLISIDFTQSKEFIVIKKSALTMVHPLVITIFYMIVLANQWWNKIFSWNALSLIGGMCYSIYLLHVPIVGTIGRFTSGIGLSMGYMPYFLFQTLLLIGVILTISTFFYVLVEKPCMKKDWHLVLWRKMFKE